MGPEECLCSAPNLVELVPTPCGVLETLGQVGRVQHLPTAQNAYRGSSRRYSQRSRAASFFVAGSVVRGRGGAEAVMIWRICRAFTVVSGAGGTLSAELQPLDWPLRTYDCRWHWIRPPVDHLVGRFRRAQRS